MLHLILLEGIQKTSELLWEAHSSVFNHAADLYAIRKVLLSKDLYSAVSPYRAGSGEKTLAQSAYCIALHQIKLYVLSVQLEYNLMGKAAGHMEH